MKRHVNNPVADLRALLAINVAPSAVVPSRGE